MRIRTACRCTIVDLSKRSGDIAAAQLHRCSTKWSGVGVFTLRWQ